MLNRELFRKKLQCAVNQAKVRGLRLSTAGWGINICQGYWRIGNAKNTYILAIFLDGVKVKRIISGNVYESEENKQVAEILRTTPDIVQSFNNGHCTGGAYSDNKIHPAKDLNDIQYAFYMGREFRKYLQ